MIRTGVPVQKFANPRIDKIYDLFRYRKKALTCLYIIHVQLYNMYAYIAFREYLKVSTDAQMTLNIF